MLTAVLVSVVVIFVTVKLSRRPSNFPPGPRGLPLIGYVPFLSRLDPTYPYLGMIKLAQQYGPIVGFYLGPTQAFVSVTGYEAVKEVFANEDLNGRPDFKALRERNFGKRLGLMFVDGEFWREQRRFTLRHLRDLGFGKTSLEGTIHEEIQDLSNDLLTKSRENEKHVVDFAGFFNISVINVLWAIVGGSRFSRHDEKLKELLRLVEVLVRGGQPINSAVNVPLVILRRFQKFFGSALDTFPPLIKFIQDIIEEHKSNLVDDEPRDFIDVYLTELKKHTTSENSSFTDEQLIATIFDIFGAGAETTSNSIGFVLLYLIHRPDVQSKMRKELESVCGDSLPRLGDRVNLPYTEAVLIEVLRVSNITPFAVPRRAMRDAQVQGYTIPEGTIIFPNIYSVHMDKKHWGDPEVFRPERHFDSNGKIIRSDYLMPFGGGKRSCLGESLARNTYFLFTTALVKNFSFEAIPGEPLPDLLPLNGFTLGYKPFSAVVRSQSI